MLSARQDSDLDEVESDGRFFFSRFWAELGLDNLDFFLLYFCKITALAAKGSLTFMLKYMDKWNKNGTINALDAWRWRPCKFSNGYEIKHVSRDH